MNKNSASLKIQTLTEYLQRSSRQVDLGWCLSTYQDLCRALLRFQSKGLSVVFVTPRQILLERGEPPKLHSLVHEDLSRAPTPDPYRSRYLAPEWGNKNQVGESQNIYSLGVLLYALLHRTDPPPFALPRFGRTRAEQLLLEPFQKVVQQATELHPTARFASLEDLARAFLEAKKEYETRKELESHLKNQLENKVKDRFKGLLQDELKRRSLVGGEDLGLAPEPSTGQAQALRHASRETLSGLSSPKSFVSNAPQNRRDRRSPLAEEELPSLLPPLESSGSLDTKNIDAPQKESPHRRAASRVVPSAEPSPWRDSSPPATESGVAWDMAPPGLYSPSKDSLPSVYSPSRDSLFAVYSASQDALPSFASESLEHKESSFPSYTPTPSVFATSQAPYSSPYQQPYGPPNAALYGEASPWGIVPEEQLEQAFEMDSGERTGIIARSDVMPSQKGMILWAMIAVFAAISLFGGGVYLYGVLQRKKPSAQKQPSPRPFVRRAISPKGAGATPASTIVPIPPERPSPEPPLSKESKPTPSREVPAKKSEDDEEDE